MPGMTPRYPLLLLVAGTAAAAIGSLPLWFAPLVLGIYVDEFGFTLLGAGALVTAELVALALATFDTRAGRGLPIRSVALGTAGIAVAANLGSLLADTWPLLLFLRVAAGAAAGALYRVMTVAVAASPARQSLYGAVVTLASLVCAGGLALLPLAAARGIESAPFVAQAVVFLLLAPLLAGFAGHARSATATDSASAIEARWLVVGNALLWLSVGAFWSVAERVGVAHGIAKGVIYTAFSLSSLASVGGALLATALAQRISPGLAAGAGLVVYVAAIGACLADGAAEVYVLGIVLFNAALLFVLPFLLGRAAALPGGGHVAASLAATMMLGQGVGPLIGVTTLQSDPMLLGAASVAAAIIGVSAMIVSLHRPVAGQAGA